MADPFVKKTYYTMTLDPVHIGTGGYRLGRVDNTITREPGTNIPKIPGSSISGATRAYTAMAIQNGNFVEIGKSLEVDYKIYRKCKYQRPAYKFKEIIFDRALIEGDVNGKPIFEGKDQNKEKYYSCAGKGAGDGEGHCGEPDCEVCIPFGFSKKGNSFQGLAQFFDARILFFPVHSMIGPVWITCQSVFNDFCDTLKSQGITLTIDNKLDNDALIQTDLIETDKCLNLGWILLKNKEKAKPINASVLKLYSEINDRVVLVSNKLFSRIVNDNLEVRTSVAINPATGAAEEGALYTYEAIPRATIMWFDVVYSNPKYFRINGAKSISLSAPINYRDPLRSPEVNDQIGFMAFNIERGFTYLETLGIGGMNTRGMGRVRVLNIGG